MPASHRGPLIDEFGEGPIKSKNYTIFFFININWDFEKENNC